MAEFSDDEKRVLGETITEMMRSIKSHKAALEKLAANDKAAYDKAVEMAEEIRRLKEWTNAPEKNDPRGPAPGTLWGMAVRSRDLILRVCEHLGLSEDQPKGGEN